MSNEHVEPPPEEPGTPEQAGTPDAGSPTPEASKSKTGGRPKKGQLDLEKAKIGFVGAGMITRAIVDGLTSQAKIDPKKMFVVAPRSGQLDTFKSQGISVSKRNIDVFARFDCDVIFLTFHGGLIKRCHKEGGSRPRPITTNYIPNMKHPIYILSVVSGVTVKEIKPCLLNPEHPEKYILEMHRIMINGACQYGLGICAVDVEPDSNKLSAPIRTLLSSIAKLEYVVESQMDAACAIAGSGLAFAYYFINAMADGAFKMGLSRVMAIKFAAKTVQCGALCLLESGRHPGELRDAVCSPSGPAIYGIHVLDRADVASGICAAVEAAHKRAEDLSNDMGDKNAA